jgi:hypothetical protein
MKGKAVAELSALRIEGGALSGSVMRRLMERSLPFSDPASYHLERGYTINEAVTRSWNRMLSAWRAFLPGTGAPGGS